MTVHGNKRLVSASKKPFTSTDAAAVRNEDSSSPVGEFKHLKTRPRAAEALELLQKVASMVKPIMIKHEWKLPVLQEFFPKNDNLLGMNVNRGRKILIRLRPHYDDKVFFPLDDCIGTMLHELTHNVHGPHDEGFYNMLGELNAEMDALEASGYSGEGFLSNGTRLGGSFGSLSLQQARKAALRAAEQRAQYGVLTAGSGKRLGGMRPTRSRPLREILAEAAERRLRDEKSCASTLGISDAELEEATAGTVSTTAVDHDDHQQGSVPVEVADLTEVTYRRRRKLASPPSNGAEWSCPRCTLKNQLHALQCNACGQERPSKACLQNEDIFRSTDGPGSLWICEKCSLVNEADKFLCIVCEGVRTGGS